MTFSKRSALFIFIGALCALELLFFIPSTVQATDSVPDWMNSNVTIAKKDDLTWVDGDQYTYGNIPCEQMNASSWTWQSNGWTSWKTRISKNDCVVMGTSAYFGYREILPFGSELWQQLDFSNYQHPTVFWNPGTNGAAMVTNSYADYISGPHELYYTDDVVSLFSVFSKDTAGNVIRSPKAQFERKLTYTDGTPVSVTNLSGISYSSNGRWLYVNIASTGQLRIDTTNMSVVSFAPGSTSQYALYTAISNSGNTIATHAYLNGLKVYDLTHCEAEKPNYSPRSCATRDLTQNLRDGIIATLDDPSKLGWVDVKEIKFIGESQLQVLAYYVYNGQAKSTFMNLNIPAHEQPMRYLALGDSFSSGEGAGNYYEATNFYADANNYNFCHQSRIAYSELLNSWLKPEFYDSVACSGAQMKDIYYSNQGDGDYIKNGKPQAVSLTEDDIFIQRIKSSNLPGYIPQESFLGVNTANVATISIGGNDIGFKDIIMNCVINIECYSSRDDKEKLADLIASKIPKLAATFATIKQNMSGSTPKLYVMGYPRLFAERSCGQFMNIDEQAFANHLVDYLDDAIRMAAARASVFYVDVSHAFYGEGEQDDHRLCGTATAAANGAFFDAANMTQGQPLLDSISRALVSSYHPNALGHQLLAGVIRQQTEGFTVELPVASGTSERPSAALYSKLVGDTDDVYQESGSVTQNITKDVVVEEGQSISVSYSLGEDEGGLPVENATITVVAQSTPTTLGSLSMLANGTASGEFVLPQSLEPGVHTIHLLYTDISGQKHDIYQYVYLIASETDFDGDGVPNNQEVCVLSKAMGVDQNNNGLDDACDTDIAVAKPTKASNNGSVIGELHISNDSADSDMSSLVYGWPYSISMTLSYDATKEASIPQENSTMREMSGSEKKPNSSTTYVYLVLAILIMLGVASYFIKRKRF